MAITQAEARQAAAMLATCDGTDEVHGAMVAALKLEYGPGWDEDRAGELLRARIMLAAEVDRAGA